MISILGGALPDGGPVDFLPVLLVVLVAVILAAAQLFISQLLGARAKAPRVKDSPSECGIAPTGVNLPPITGGGSLVAVLFILFDIEVVFLYPWAVHFGSGVADGEVFATRAALVRFLFVEMLVFLVILFLGWYWVVRKKALDWEEA